MCLAAVLVVALPALLELARAARSAEKLFDTLRRELPPTLEAIRLTGLEISDLTDDLSQGVESAGNVVKQVDRSLTGTRQQLQEVNSTTRSIFTGFKVAWKTLTRPSQRRRSRGSYRTPERLTVGDAAAKDYPASYWQASAAPQELAASDRLDVELPAADLIQEPLGADEGGRE